MLVVPDGGSLVTTTAPLEFSRSSWMSRFGLVGAGAAVAVKLPEQLPRAKTSWSEAWAMYFVPAVVGLAVAVVPPASSVMYGTRAAIRATSS